MIETWWATVLLINIVLLILGCVLEALGITIMMVPILRPIADAAGIDMVHLGVFMTVNLMIGLVTPPLGLLLYVACDITVRPFDEIVRAVAPFLIPLIAGLAIAASDPQTVL